MYILTKQFSRGIFMKFCFFWKHFGFFVMDLKHIQTTKLLWTFLFKAINRVNEWCHFVRKGLNNLKQSTSPSSEKISSKNLHSVIERFNSKKFHIIELKQSWILITFFLLGIFTKKRNTSLNHCQLYTIWHVIKIIWWKKKLNYE